MIMENMLGVAFEAGELVVLAFVLAFGIVDLFQMSVPDHHGSVFVYQGVRRDRY